jgi:hypothetical protein
MPATPLNTWLTRTDTAWHLAAQTVSDIGLSAKYYQHEYGASLLSKKVLRVLARSTGSKVLGKIDPLTCFDIDGDSLGRCRADLDRDARRQRRVLIEARRQRVSRVLHGLGGTSKEVERTIMRSRQDVERHESQSLHGYLMTHLPQGDLSAWFYLPGYWASDFNGVWVSTPAPVRRYLRRCRALDRPV